MTKEQILSQLDWRDEETQQGNSVGTVKELFSDYEVLPIKQSKNGAKRASLMMKKDGKTKAIALSLRATELFRNNHIELEHLMGFPCIWNEEMKALFIGIPSQGWTAVKNIVLKEYKPAPVSTDLLNSIA